MSGTRVAVVSPDGRVRTSLHHLLTSDDRLTVLDPVGTALEAADVVVVDLGTGRPGSLRTLGGAAPLVVLGFDEPGHPVGSPDPRVFAYLSKSEAPDRLLTTVRAAAEHDLGPRPGWWGTTALVLAVLVGPWTVWLSRVAEDRGVIGWHVPQGLALWSITPVLLLTLGLVSGRAGLRDLGSRLVRWRVPAATYGVALGLPAVVSLLTAAVVAGTGGEVPVGRLLSWPAALVYLAYGTGLFLLTEEAGWRAPCCRGSSAGWVRRSPPGRGCGVGGVAPSAAGGAGRARPRPAARPLPRAHRGHQRARHGPGRRRPGQCRRRGGVPRVVRRLLLLRRGGGARAPDALGRHRTHGGHGGRAARGDARAAVPAGGRAMTTRAARPAASGVAPTLRA